MRKTVYPLWIHTPAVVFLGLMIFKVVSSWPLPDRVAMHFNASGEVNRWGHPWEGLGISFGIMITFIALSVLLSEIWGRHEKQKTFNWFVILTSAVLACLTITTSKWIDVAKSEKTLWTTPWAEILTVMAAGALTTAVLEYLRPFRQLSRDTQMEETGELGSMIASRQQTGQPWVYWEMQNPRYVSFLSLGIWAGMTALFFVLFYSASSGIHNAVILLAGLAGLANYGGLRVKVTREQLVLRLGLTGIPLLRIGLSEIESVQVQTFEPLHEFGGWGPWRLGRPKWARSGGQSHRVLAFYFCGTKAVKIVRKDGSIYLIGSDHPERLCTVLQTAAALQPSNLDTKISPQTSKAT